MAEQLREVSVTYIGIMAGNWAGAQVRAGQLPQGPRVPGYQAWSPRTMSYLRTRDLRSHLGLLATSCLGLPDIPFFGVPTDPDTPKGHSPHFTPMDVTFLFIETGPNH